MHRLAENGATGTVGPFESPESWEALQWRVKVTAFRGGGYEVSAGLIDREKARDQWRVHQGFGYPRRPKGEDQDGVGELDADSLRRARQRARTRVRQIAKNIGATHLLTLSTRQRENTREEMLGCWARFLRLYERASGKRLAFLAVLEKHPTNPGHLHWHVAVTSFLPAGLLRRLWYIALGGNGSERGGETPGGVHMRQFHAREAGRRASRIARYIAKYLTKDSVEEFNKKRYSCSKGAAAGLEAHPMWLAGQTLGDMLAELFELFPGLRAHPEDLWVSVTGRRVWGQYVCDGAGADPPF